MTGPPWGQPLLLRCRDEHVGCVTWGDAAAAAAAAAAASAAAAAAAAQCCKGIRRQPLCARCLKGPTAQIIGF